MSDEERQRADDEDAALMQKAAADDMAAFEELVRRHQKAMLNFFARSGVYSDCEDMVQQTFVRLFRYRHRYVRRAKFTTFLFLIARQVRLDELRREARVKKLKGGVAEQAKIDGPVQPDNLRPLVADELQDALNKLSDEHREAVVLGIVQDMPYAEVAKVLGIPVGTVKSRVHNALLQLRGILKDERP